MVHVGTHGIDDVPSVVGVLQRFLISKSTKTAFFKLPLHSLGTSTDMGIGRKECQSPGQGKAGEAVHGPLVKHKIVNCLFYTCIQYLSFFQNVQQDLLQKYLEQGRIQKGAYFSI